MVVQSKGARAPSTRPPASRGRNAASARGQSSAAGSNVDTAGRAAGRSSSGAPRAKAPRVAKKDNELAVAADTGKTQVQLPAAGEIPECEVCKRKPGAEVTPTSISAFCFVEFQSNIISHCNALLHQCIELHCIALHCIASQPIASHHILCCFALVRLQCFMLLCYNALLCHDLSRLHGCHLSHCIESHCIAVRGTACQPIAMCCRNAFASFTLSISTLFVRIAML